MYHKCTLSKVKKVLQIKNNQQIYKYIENNFCKKIKQIKKKPKHTFEDSPPFFFYFTSTLQLVKKSIWWNYYSIYKTLQNPPYTVTYRWLTLFYVPLAYSGARLYRYNSWPGFGIPTVQHKILLYFIHPLSGLS